jgi:hypothetical protein
LHALFHIADSFARLGAILANVSALGTDVSMMFGTAQHKIGAGRADLSAVEHEAQVIGSNVGAAHFQAMSRCHAQTGGVARLTILDALLHLSGQMIHSWIFQRFSKSVRQILCLRRVFMG